MGVTTVIDGLTTILTLNSGNYAGPLAVVAVLMLLSLLVMVLSLRRIQLFFWLQRCNNQE